MQKRKPITRRDFLDGVAIGTVAAATMPLGSALASNEMPSNIPLDKSYPPGLTGMRGNHPGSYDIAHPLAWADDAPVGAIHTGEEYDLIVVGGGLSGLAAACLFQRERGPDQRILILDNHDDFGGHAKRNEFESEGRMLLSIGGAVNMEFANGYSDDSRRLLEEVGIDFERLEEAQVGDHLQNYGDEKGIFLKADDGTGKIVTGPWRRALQGSGDYKGLINQLPLPQAERDKIIKLAGGDWDYLVGLSISERMDYLDSTSYHQFLMEKVGLATETLSLFDSWPRLFSGVGGDGLSVHEAILMLAPGLGSVGWPWDLAESLIFGGEEPPGNSLLFPDGNASVARLMVRHLIPDVAPGSTIDDIVEARFDYSKLDQKTSPVRLRLNSTAIRAKQKGDQVTVSYVKEGKPYTVKAKHCILACFNSIIPHMCPGLPEEQKEGLKYGVKVPFLWASVLIKDGSVFEKAGAQLIDCPKGYFQVVTPAPATELGDYRVPKNPGDPRVVFMMRSPVPIKEDPGQTARDLYREARYEMLQTPFSTYETEIRAQLTDLFGAHGFDAERDIEAITVNRWAHGYAYGYLTLDDGPFEEGAYPHEIGRKQFGRISIANTDAAAIALLNSAIEEAWRAVQEQLYINDD